MVLDGLDSFDRGLVELAGCEEEAASGLVGPLRHNCGPWC